MVDETPASLWEAERHTALQDIAWDEGAARYAIEQIAADARSAFSAEQLWPLHPNDGETAAGPACSLYDGAAGVVWALDYLAHAGACPAGETFGAVLPGLIGPNRTEMIAYCDPPSGLLTGDLGLWIAHWRVSRAPETLDALADAIAATADHPAQEYMWGAPGAMRVALALHEATGEARWAALVRRCADALGRSLEMDEAQGCRLWTQDLYGAKRHYLGAVHGFAGNAFALIACRDLLPPAQWAGFSAAIAQTIAATAQWSGALVNWPPALGPVRPGRPAFLVQHCHGAPGMVVALAGLDQPIDALLTAAGETVWQAGPLVKGANLCHGTAGNGYAFLKLFERTGDPLWLDRARRFAMHAMAASAADAEAIGRRHYSLWSGDLGLACYLLDCIEAKARFPTMDVF